MHRASCHGMDRRANGSRQIDAVMKIPAISVDTRTEGRIHFVWRGGFVEGPEEVSRVSSAQKILFDENLLSSLLIFHLPF